MSKNAPLQSEPVACSGENPIRWTLWLLEFCSSLAFLQHGGCTLETSLPFDLHSLLFAFCWSSGWLCCLCGNALCLVMSCQATVCLALCRPEAAWYKPSMGKSTRTKKNKKIIPQYTQVFLSLYPWCLGKLREHSGRIFILMGN